MYSFNIKQDVPHTIFKAYRTVSLISTHNPSTPCRITAYLNSWCLQQDN